jgi:hypothetical protein
MIEIIGGPDRDRTDDLFHAMEARSQLRHRPTCCRDATLLLSGLGLNSSMRGRCARQHRCQPGYDDRQSLGKTRLVVGEHLRSGGGGEWI